MLVHIMAGKVMNVTDNVVSTIIDEEKGKLTLTDGETKQQRILFLRDLDKIYINNKLEWSRWPER